MPWITAFSLDPTGPRPARGAIAATRSAEQHTYRQCDPQHTGDNDPGCSGSRLSIGASPGSRETSYEQRQHDICNTTVENYICLNLTSRGW
jgi:hypothetical protein